MGKARREKMGLTEKKSIKTKIKEGYENLSGEVKGEILDKWDQAESIGRSELVKKVMSGTGCSWEESVRACQGYTDEPEPY